MINLTSAVQKEKWQQTHTPDSSGQTRLDQFPFALNHPN